MKYMVKIIFHTSKFIIIFWRMVSVKAIETEWIKDGIFLLYQANITFCNVISSGRWENVYHLSRKKWLIYKWTSVNNLEVISKCVWTILNISLVYKDITTWWQWYYIQDKLAECRYSISELLIDNQISLLIIITFQLFSVEIFLTKFLHSLK